MDIQKLFQEFKQRFLIGTPAFNVNTIYSDTAKRKAAAQAALRATPYGRGGLISVDTDAQGRVIFKSTINGAVFDDIEEAFDAVNEYSLSDIKVFGKRTGFGTGLTKAMEKAERVKSQYGATTNIMEKISQRLSSLDPASIAFLEESGIDVSDLGNIRMQVVTLEKKNNVSELMAQVNRMRQAGTLDGIIMPDDEGARVLSFVNGSKILNTYQTNAILEATGFGYFDRQDLLGALSGTGNNLAKMVEKSPKRARAFLAPREISLAGDELESVIRKFTGGGTQKSLTDLTLVLDPQYEILKKFALGNKYNFDDNRALRAYYRPLDAEKYIDSILANFTGESSLSGSELEGLKKAIASFNKKSFNKNVDPKDFAWGSDQLKEYLLDSKGFAGGDSRRIAAISGIFESIEKSYDGADSMNSRFIASYIKELTQKQAEIRRQLSSTSDAHQKQAALAMMDELNDKISRIRSGDYTQITGRGRLTVFGQTLNIKNAFGAESEFRGPLNRFASVISRFSLKREVGLAGDTESIIMSGIGRKGELVYADPVSAMFNAQIFTNKSSLEIIKRNQQQIIDEYKKAIDEGIVPSKLRRMLENQAAMNIDDLPAAKRLSGARNKEFAQSILAMLNSGASPKDSPLLSNMLHKSFATMAFKEKEYANGISFFEPVLPETQRFALNTERSLLASQSNVYRMGRSAETGKYGFESISLFGQDGTTDVLKFRIKGHTALLPDFAPAMFYHSLGGFDLDDKGLVRTITYKDAAGNNRLGSYMFRQPSGPEEIIFQKINMDQETISALFGNEYYTDALEEIIQEKTAANEDVTQFLRIKEYLDPESSFKGRNIVDQVDEFESALATLARKVGTAYELSEEAYGKIFQHGSSSLKISDLINQEGNPFIPEYTKRGIVKAMLGDTPLDIHQDILDVINSNSISSDLRARLSAPGLSYEDIIRELGDYAKSATDPIAEQKVSTIISTALNSMVTKRLEQAEGNLGQYVNRSGMVTSILDQYQAFYDNADPAVQNFLKNDINYTAILIPQESAIDLSVNVSTTKTVNLGVQQAIAQNFGALNEDNVAKQIASLYKKAGTGEAVTLAELGEASIATMGRIMGLTRAINGVEQDHIVGLDEFLLEGKLNKNDRELVLRQMIAGMEDALGNAGLSQSIRDRADIESQIAQYRKALNEGDDAIGKMLADTIALSKDHTYATLYKLSGLAQDTSMTMDVLSRKAFGGIGGSSILALAESSAEEDALARTLMRRHADKLTEAHSITGKVLKEASSSELYHYAGRLNQIGEEVLSDIGRAAEMSKITRKGLFNAIDKIASEAGLDIGGLRYVPEALGSSDLTSAAAIVHRDLMLNKQIRRLNYFTSMESANADSVMNMMGLTSQGVDPNDPKGRIIADELLEVRSKKLLADTANAVPTDLERNTMMALSGQEDQIVDKAARRQARTQAEIIRAKIELSRLRESGVKNPVTGMMDSVDDLIDNLNASGHRETIQSAEQLFDDSSFAREVVNSIGLGDEDAGTSLFRSSAKYKRITLDSFKEGGNIADLFKNPLVKKGAIGLGALVVGSFAYSAYKDRSSDDLGGPPMLPGGSAYEGDYPDRIPEIGNFGPQKMSSGVDYKVSLYGNRKAIEQFNAAAGGLVNGNVDTTMYNSISNMRQDPYSAIASSY